jgi:hypothetical protein
MMFILDPKTRTNMLRFYREQQAFFPLIGAVISGAQDGIVYGNDPVAPSRIYVEHAFGFAQVFGERDRGFDQELVRYLLSDITTGAVKVRLYAPGKLNFLEDIRHAALQAERRRFILPEIKQKDALPSPYKNSFDVRPASKHELDLLDSKFHALTRFWRTREDFLARALAVAAWKSGEPVALCYAAAVSCGQAEIDVMTLPDYRRMGLGALVVTSFVAGCLARDIRPVWDCFTNNTGSMALCAATGFVPLHPPYPFYTINRSL